MVISKRGISKALNQLVAAGLLVRQGEKRGAIYRITTTGQAVLAEPSAGPTA
jgi:DNA-binding PadR family transcriptional regulator